MNPVDRRTEPRHVARLAITVGFGDKSLLAYTQNVSGNGAFLDCAEPIEHGTMLTLRFLVPTDAEPISTQAEVRWVAKNADGEPLGVGVRLAGLRPREMRAWARYLRSLK